MMSFCSYLLNFDQTSKSITMKKVLVFFLGATTTFCINLFFAGKTDNNHQQTTMTTFSTKAENSELKLGAFSMSLSVKDLKTSKAFYESLGFTAFGGDMGKNYLIMKNGNALIGLFQGMFAGNILTFNPGWDENAKNITEFDDVRKIQKELKGKGINLTAEADDKTTGPAHIMLTDPDGNQILIDQHR